MFLWVKLIVAKYLLRRLLQNPWQTELNNQHDNPENPSDIYQPSWYEMSMGNVYFTHFEQE